MDLNYMTSTCIHPFLLFWIPNYFYNLFLSLITTFDSSYREQYSCLLSAWEVDPCIEVDLEIFDEVLKSFLDAELSKNIVMPIFNLDDNFPIQKKATINFNCEQIWPHPFIYVISISMFSALFNIQVFVYRKANGSKK